MNFVDRSRESGNPFWEGFMSTTEPSTIIDLLEARKAVLAARREVRAAAARVNQAAQADRDVHGRIEDLVRAGTALEQVEQAYAAVQA